MIAICATVHISSCTYVFSPTMFDTQAQCLKAAESVTELPTLGNKIKAIYCYKVAAISPSIVCNSVGADGCR